MAEIQLNECWKEKLKDEFKKEYMIDLKSFLKKEYDSGKRIYPKGGEFFNALNSTDFNDVKVVILGQDPYHGPGQAHGLCFSVQKGVPPPPSLKNIFKELQGDLGLAIPNHGFLEPWARQGVLLLNAVLSVEESKAGSHAGKGWEKFTDRIIEVLNEEKKNLVFVLWGGYAQNKGKFIDRNKHLVLECVHPSPLSVYRGFFGSKPFSKINNYLKSKDQKEIVWDL
ncbi:MAG TPA: uracil-DNA glycosylase [Pseudobdellovibrionaceae bacterium]|nr:uracil-DNA glycosylase [Pseudobdellovibrionaceae bacterium]